MEFLNVLAIKKIAVRKGCVAERTATIKHRHYVRLTGPDGVEMQGTRGVGLGLLEAKRRLEMMPDLPNGNTKGHRRKGSGPKLRGGSSKPRPPPFATQ
jgi:hypothetical protein